MASTSACNSGARYSSCCCSCYNLSNYCLKLFIFIVNVIILAVVKIISACKISGYLENQKFVQKNIQKNVI